MADDMSSCPDPAACAAPKVQRQGERGFRPMDRLPTLQRNALCKVFDRPVFQPEEVAALGYRRLQQAEGIGKKGLNEIAAWLGAFGCTLAAPVREAGPRQTIQKRAKKNIELAVRLLRTHGYLVHPGKDPSSPGKA